MSLGSHDPGKTGQTLRPVSQETCPDKQYVHGRGVPVVRLRSFGVTPPRIRRRVASAFAPNISG